MKLRIVEVCFFSFLFLLIIIAEQAAAFIAPPWRSSVKFLATSEFYVYLALTFSFMKIRAWAETLTELTSSLDQK